MAAIKNWHLHQLDVNNAFLHGDLHEDVYMESPPRIAATGGHNACRLLKSLYRLKQASKQWFAKLSNALIHYGFFQGYSNSSFFIKRFKHSFIALLAYVDDVLLASDNILEIQQLKSFLHDELTIKDLGQLKYFLGLEVVRSKTGISLCQRKYAIDILEVTGLTGSKPADFPMESNLKLSTSNTLLYEDPSGYHRLVGRLLYSTITRPDLAYSAQVLTHFRATPTVSHFQAATRVLSYLKAIPGHGLFFLGSSNLHLNAFSDSDWAGCVDTQRSFTGFAIFLGNSLMSWKLKKQQSVALQQRQSIELLQLLPVKFNSSFMLYKT